MNLIQPGKQMLKIGISGRDASIRTGMTSRPFCCIAV
jgi:hypothetical protein